jgi:prepilin-type N-terminal cleavage/methylation domain-containing protein
MNFSRPQASIPSYGRWRRLAALVPRSLRARGFTLVELMIVVSILGIMASIAAPKFASMLRKAQEGAAKGNLGMLRSGLRIYYSDNQGLSPTCDLGPDSVVFANSLQPKYIGSVPEVKSGLHPPIDDVYCDIEMAPGSIHDGQGWYYDGVLPEDSNFGGIWVACDHTDVKGSFWTSY